MKKEAVVLGAGISGLAAAKRLHADGYAVKIYDQAKLSSERHKTLDPFCSLIHDEASELSLNGKEEFLVLSPGISLDNKLLQSAKELEVISEVDLGVKYIGQPSVAVTGTNGKTTVSLLIAEMLGLRALGNVGNPLVTEAPGPYVAELSSYQLEASKFLAPNVALWLNQSPDHLERHGNMESYIAAKGRIFSAAKYSILNADDPHFETMRAYAKGEVVLFGESQADCKLEGSSIRFRDEAQFTLSNWKLLGKHNRLNCTAAAAAAKLAGANNAQIQSAIDAFSPPEHRLEVLPNGYINDSKSTNVCSTVMALQAVTELDYSGRLHLILGGQSKGESLEPLMNALPLGTKVYAFGHDGMSFIDALGGEYFSSLELLFSYLSAKKGDVVLFSPACASFDQFRNFEERGLRFKNLAHK